MRRSQQSRDFQIQVRRITRCDTQTRRLQRAHHEPLAFTPLRHYFEHNVVNNMVTLERSVCVIQSNKTTVFYDGGCRLCRREIDHYRRIDQSGRIRWLDITREREALATYGLSVHASMARLHVYDRDGCWQTGAYGFAAIWAELPRYRWLARALRRARLLPALEIVYIPFARWRLKRRCTVSPCPSSL